MPAPSTPEEVAGTATQEVQTLSQLRLPQKRPQGRLLKGSGGLEFMPAPSTPEEAAGTATQGTGRFRIYASSIYPRRGRRDGYSRDREVQFKSHEALPFLAPY